MAGSANVQLNVTGNANQQLDKINSNVQKVSKSFKQMGDQVGALNGVFGRLAGIVAGLGIVSFGQKMLKAADDVADLSEAIGVSIAEIKNLQAAFAASGGDADGATMAYTRLSKAVAEARDGNEGLRKKFEELGVTQQMLAENDLSKIMTQVSTGMALLGPTTDKTAMSMELLGKANNTLNFGKVNSELEANKQKYQELAPYIKQQADLFENLRVLGKSYSEELVKGTGGLVGMFVELTANTKEIAKSLADLTKIVALAIGTWLIFSKLIPGVRLAMDALQKTFQYTAKSGGTVKSAAAGIVTIFKNLFSSTGKIIKSFTDAGQTVTLWVRLKQVIFGLSAILANFLRIAFRLAGWVGVIITVAQAIDFLVEKFFGFSIIDWAMGKISMLISKVKEFAQSLGIIDADAPKPAAGAAPPPPGTTPPPGTNTPVVDTNKKLREEIQNVTKAYREQALERVEALRNELRFMGMSEDQVELEKNKLEIEKSRKDTLKELADKEREILADNERTKESKKTLLGEIYRQRDAVNEVANAERAASEEAIKALQARRLEQEKLNNALELTKIAMDNSQSLKNLQDELSIVGLYGDKLQDRQTQLAVEQELQGKLLSIEQKKLDLENQRTKLGEDRYRQEMSHLTAQEAQARKYADARLKGEQAVTAAQRALRSDEKNAVGQRLEELARSVDPAVVAVQQLDSVFGNMNNAIDNFVKTGKFSFKDFARSVIQDIIAIQLKAAATKILSSVVGSLFGLADGGPATAGKPYVVGEEGPEIFVPKASGTVIPNGQAMGGAGTGAGAGGGGQTVNNYITNNISAVDAKSVAQLFAENRKVLLGSVQLAQKEAPYTNR